MPNTLTNLIPTIYEAADIVARELVGFIPAVNRDSQKARAALNQVVRFPIVPSFSAADIAAGSGVGPDPAAVTIGSDTLTIDKSRSVSFFWEGEESAGLKSGGQFDRVIRDQFAQAMRALCNEVEADLAGLFYGASRIYGTPGTTPFATAGDLSDLAQLRKILEDNGAPTSDLHFVMDTAAAAVIRGKQSGLFKVNEAGSSGLLRLGSLGEPLEGFNLHVSGQVASVSQAAATGYVTNGIQAVGATGIIVQTGAAAISKGAIISFAADTVNKYVVAADYAGGAGTIQINKPGLRVSIPTANAITVNTTAYRANLGFDRNAIALVTRAPYMPEGGDAADDVTEVQDPNSGLAFQVALYRQRRRVVYEVGLAWGKKIIKSDFLGGLAG